MAEIVNRGSLYQQIEARTLFSYTSTLIGENNQMRETPSVIQH